MLQKNIKNLPLIIIVIVKAGQNCSTQDVCYISFVMVTVHTLHFTIVPTIYTLENFQLYWADNINQNLKKLLDIKVFDFASMGVLSNFKVEIGLIQGCGLFFLD